MSTRQIAVRLPEDVAAFVDAEVAEGHAPSRAAVVTQALRRERRRRAALADVRILRRAAASADADDLGALAEHAAHVPLDVD